MPVSVTPSGSGVVVYNNGVKILLDPHKEATGDVMFFSHAHTDHLVRRTKKNTSRTFKILASKATSYLARARGIRIGLSDSQESCDGYELIDTCHVLGSRGLLVGDNLYYTGDISIRQRGFMNGALIPKVHTLIIESTFGKPKYVFPSVNEVVHKTNKIIAQMFDRGVSVLLLGYPLGKAQLLTQLFRYWEPLYIDDSVEKINAIYREFGVKLKEGVIASAAEDMGLLSKSSPWVMIGPLIPSRASGYIKYIKERYRAVTIGFSGWALDNNYRYMMGLDYAMPLSDHCDYEELVEIVKRSQASKIYTFHGFSTEFARSLKRLGFDAQPVTRCGKQIQLPNDSLNLSLDLFINK
jgi:putative mRNA 3-end processing factor